jgi:predicted phage terminase large subunit-like protein
MIQSWDCAFKDKSSSDYVVGQVWGVQGADKFLLDQVRGHFSFGATLAAIRSLSAKWPETYTKLVEDKANGTAVIDTLKHEISGIIAVEPEGGKEARAHAVSGEVEAHNVYLPETAVWVHDFIEECASFPAGAHDDQVDGMTQALTRFRGHSITLGLVEYLKQLQKEEDDARNKVRLERPTGSPNAGATALEMQQPLAQGPSCPTCNGTAIVRFAGIKRCSACGYQWPYTGPIAPSPSRKDILRRSG